MFLILFSVFFKIFCATFISDRDLPALQLQRGRLFRLFYIVSMENAEMDKLRRAYQMEVDSEEMREAPTTSTSSQPHVAQQSPLPPPSPSLAQFEPASSSSSLSSSSALLARSSAALPLILPMDEEEKRDGEKEEDEDEAATHRHPISTSHDGLPEILPLEMTSNTSTSTAAPTSPSRTINVTPTTPHNAAPPTTDPSGLLAAAQRQQQQQQQQRIAAVPALHSPAHDVMPAFGQLMGHDVRPGTPHWKPRLAGDC